MYKMVSFKISFFIYIVINITRNFLIKPLSLMVRVKQKLYYQRVPTIQCDVFNKNNIDQW